MAFGESVGRLGDWERGKLVYPNRGLLLGNQPGHVPLGRRKRCGSQANTDALEFLSVYGLTVVPVPTALPIARKDYDDAVYRTARKLGVESDTLG